MKEVKDHAKAVKEKVSTVVTQHETTRAPTVAETHAVQTSADKKKDIVTKCQGQDQLHTLVDAIRIAF